METWLTVILVLHVVVALAVIGLVLLQHGKGADMGSGFGGGSSGSLFGASGSANFLSRATAVLATVFFLTSLGLAYLATHKPRSVGGVMDAVKTEQPASAPASKAGEPAPAPKDAPAAASKDVPGTASKDVPASKAKDVPN
jgi:preprotein translocase subunit SecG